MIESVWEDCAGYMQIHAILYKGLEQMVEGWDWNLPPMDTKE
jgi:hypothetical protein